jgi:hypothetical protein
MDREGSSNGSRSESVIHLVTDYAGVLRMICMHETGIIEMFPNTPTTMADWTLPNLR